MNVIWIVSDTVRADHLGCYGNNTIHTPSLDALAAKSVRFNRHYAASFPTMPARADFFTGLHTASFMSWEPLSEDLVTLAPILKNAGVHTAAAVDTPFFQRTGMNYDRGFLTFIEVQCQEYWLGGLGDDTRRAWRFESDRFAPQTFKKSMEWLEHHYKEHFFLYIDVWDPHEPWDAPAYYTDLYWQGYDGELVTPVYDFWHKAPDMTEEKVRKAHACYCGELTMVDTWIGRLLKQVEYMGLMENTAIIFTTDHGFYFGEHGGRFGKMTLGEVTEDASAVEVPGAWARGPAFEQPVGQIQGWGHSPLFEEVVACPLLIYSPGVPCGVYKGLTSATDLMPTVLGIMGQKVPDGLEGQSLLPMIRDTNLEGREFVVTSHPYSNPMGISREVDGQARVVVGSSDSTITTDEYSLLFSVEQGKSWLYHLPSDPKEEKNIVNERPDVARHLHQLFVKFLRENNLAPHLLEPRLELRL